MGTAIALGNFDGVHKAHEALVRHMLDAAEKRGLVSMAYVFHPHPHVLLGKGKSPSLLMTTEMKVRRLSEIGTEKVHLETRGMDVLSLSPEAFVEKVLIGELNARYVTAGFNYRFGKNAAGDAARLKALCSANGITCEIMDSVETGGAPISSTRMRALLINGDVKSVNAMSFAPYTLTGKVQTGKKLGHTIGFPTVNVEIPAELLVPRKGVYISLTKIGNTVYKSVTNIGQNPTVENAVPRAESHLLDFSEEVYGRETEITLLEYIRPEQKFSGITELCAQIRQDTETTRQYFERKDLHAAYTD